MHHVPGRVFQLQRGVAAQEDCAVSCRRLPAVRTEERQLCDGIIVSKDGLQVGDLVFFRYSGESCPASHVGIYVGDGQMLHAGNRGITYASIEDGYFGDTYLCARRVINTDTAASETLTSAASESLLPRARSLGLRTSG